MAPRTPFDSVVAFLLASLPAIGAAQPEPAVPEPPGQDQGTEAPPVTDPAAGPAGAPANLPPPPPPRAAGPAAAAGGPTIQVETPAPGPAQTRRGYHVHDGFYLRLGLGLGSGHAESSSDSSSRLDYSLQGGSVVLQALVGGTPARGFAVGGLLLVGSLGADRIEVDDSDAFNETFGRYELLGAFVDGFPNPSGGFHLGGSLALAAVQLDATDNTSIDDVNGGGLGLSAWVGYDAWISPDWSLGGLIQLAGVLTREDETKRANAGGVSVSFTALYH